MGFTFTRQFTGWKDPALTELGEAEALKGAEELKKAGYVRMIMLQWCLHDAAMHAGPLYRPSLSMLDKSKHPLTGQPSFYVRLAACSEDAPDSAQIYWSGGHFYH